MPVEQTETWQILEDPKTNQDIKHAHKIERNWQSKSWNHTRLSSWYLDSEQYNKEAL